MLYFIERLLIYSVMLISAVQHNVSVIYIHIHMYMYVCFIYIYIYTFSIMVCHRLLNIVPCAIQEDLVVHPFCM